MRSLRFFSPAVMGGILLSMICMLLMQANLMLNCDVSWLMLATRRLFEGGTYSGNFFETNPPLILFIYMPAVLVSYFFSFDVEIIARVYFICLALFSFTFCYPFIKNIFKNSNLKTTAFSLTLLIVYLCLPSGEFGQREHLLILFCMPYFLAVVYQLQGDTLTRRQAVITGLLAGFGFAIKPFYLVTFAAIEIYQMVQRKNWRVVLRLDNVMLATVLLAYGVIVLLFFKDYFLVMIPLVSRYYYQGYAVSLQSMLENTFTVYCAFLLGIALLTRKRSTNPQLTTILMLCFITFFIVYFFQFSLMYYRVYPTLAIGFLLLGISFYQFLEEAEQGKLNFYFTWTLTLVLLVWLVAWSNPMWTSLVIFRNDFYLYFGILTFCVIYFSRRNASLVFCKTLVNVAIILGSAYLFSKLVTGGNGYEHRFTYTLIFVSLMLAVSLPSMPSRSAMIQVFLLGMVLFAWPAYFFENFYHSQVGFVTPREKIVSFLKNTSVNKSVYIFSTETLYTFPGVDYAKWKNASRFPFFWMLPGLLKEEKMAGEIPQIRQDKALLINMIAEDMEKDKPELIFIDTKHKFLPAGHFNYADYFFNNAKMRPIWGQYEYLTTIKDMPFYNLKVYRRVKIVEVPL
jgi:hypothetical protein